jgi:hypothetical protein
MAHPQPLHIARRPLLHMTRHQLLQHRPLALRLRLLHTAHRQLLHTVHRRLLLMARPQLLHTALRLLQEQRLAHRRVLQLNHHTP